MALIADGVVLNEGVQLGRGCILGPGVTLAAGTKIGDNVRLMSHPPKLSDFSDDEGDGSASVDPVNPGSAAYVYQRIRDEGSDDEESLADDLWGGDPGDELDDDDDDDEEDGEADEDDEDDEEGEEEEAADPEDAHARCS